MTLQIHQFPCLSDNYGFLIHDEETQTTAAIDTPDPNAILNELHEKQWNLTHIFNTHHHFDHTGGNETLKEKTNCQIYGPQAEKSRIPLIDHPLSEGDTAKLGNFEATILEVPGHTAGHIAYHFAKEKILFVGDTLFVMGCGRLFEGTAEQMWQSLSKLRRLPDETIVYCAHEYSAANAAFALSLTPNDEAVRSRKTAIDAARAKNMPTVPTRMDWEKAANPFLRADSASLAQALHMTGAAPTEIFAETRRRKDSF